MMTLNKTDHDNDTVLTIYEDIDGDSNFDNDDTDSDTIPNYYDPDDDGDGVLTKDEYDVDGDGLGFGESSQYCLENIPEGWVLNNNDLEPDCFSNDTDYCNVCGGNGLDDLGCGCFKPGPIDYCYD